MVIDNFPPPIPVRTFENTGLLIAALGAVVFIGAIVLYLLAGAGFTALNFLPAIIPLVLPGILMWWLLRRRRLKAERYRAELYSALNESE